MQPYEFQKGLPLATALIDDDIHIKPQWENNTNSVEQENTEQRVKDMHVGGCFMDVEDQFCFNIPNSQASLRRRQLSEYRKARQVRRWIDWAHKKTFLHICLSASRTQILVAGTNRFSTDRRADAVLAALKIKPEKRLRSTNCLGPGKLPIQILNKVLELDGSAFFSASKDILNFEESSELLHQAKGASTGNNHCRPLDALQKSGKKPEDSGVNADMQNQTESGDSESSEWENEDIVWENSVIFAFCSMVRSIATQFGYSGSRELEEYIALELQDWYIHPNGTVHIPPSAAVQCTRFFDTGSITILPNGLSMPVRMPIFEVRQWISREMHSKALMGTHPEVLLMPLLFRRNFRAVSKMTVTVKCDDEVNSQSPDVNDAPRVIGIFSSAPANQMTVYPVLSSQSMDCIMQILEE